jgi:toxin ParE1/3/4
MIIDTAASDELLAAAAWYDDQDEGLGGEFLGAVEDVLLRIAEAPMSYPRDRFDDRARRALVARFPYAVVFVM